MPEFTKTQQRILNVLQDGKDHHRSELVKSIDDLAEISTLHFHLFSIRQKLRPVGQDIVCTLNRRRICYRHVRLIAHSE